MSFSVTVLISLSSRYSWHSLCNVYEAWNTKQEGEVIAMMAAQLQFWMAVMGGVFLIGILIGY